VFHANILDQLIETGMKKRGFAVIEAVSHCHTLYGRKNRLGGPVEMLLWQKEAAVRVEKAQKMSEAELAGKITIGVLADREMPVYTQELKRIREVAKAQLAPKAAPKGTHTCD
jgi:2-oxoglutarate ferredoxin oxidoreductase subunit beta